jgi:hypothetical protein
LVDSRGFERAAEQIRFKRFDDGASVRCSTAVVYARSASRFRRVVVAVASSAVWPVPW